ncbi:hypothetical protein C8R44DRAFT_892391 [Mycena epipterygia]|nr:hypothetical protein C8R44DRAFT_892391 [Mycena epipterygia]
MDFDWLISTAFLLSLAPLLRGTSRTPASCLASLDLIYSALAVYFSVYTLLRVFVPSFSNPHPTWPRVATTASARDQKRREPAGDLDVCVVDLYTFLTELILPYPASFSCTVVAASPSPSGPRVCVILHKKPRL